MKKYNLLEKAVIRNARACNETQNIGMSVKFNKEFDRQGWTGSGVTMLGASGGFLFMTSSTRAPAVFNAQGFAAVDASVFTEVVVRYKYVKNRSDSIASRGIIQFQTSADSTFSEDKQEEFVVNSDGKWHEYRINMGPVSTWVGLISNLRVFFATDGQPGDEIFVSEIKIQSPTFSYCVGNCVEDSSRTILGQVFDTEPVGQPPAGWSLVNIGEDSKVFVDSDPEFRISSQRVVRLVTSNGQSPGPRMVRSLSSHFEGFFSCRFRSSLTGGDNQGRTIISALTDVVNNLSSWEVSLEADGSIRYREGESYEDFDIPVNYQADSWHDLLVAYETGRGEVSVFVDGVLVGEGLPIVFRGPVLGLSIQHGSGEPFSVFLDEIIVVERSLSDGQCPGMGTQGRAVGRPITFDRISISKDINDTLIVNIDDYGDAVVRIPSGDNLDPGYLRILLERCISSIDVGGYPYAEVDFRDGQFTIRSGTYSFDSTVVVKQHGDSELASQLGFVEEGEVVAELFGGRPHAKGFSFLNGYRSTTYELTNLVLSGADEAGYITQDPTKISPTIGSHRAGIAGQGVRIDGRARTIIDFYNRASGEGRVTNLRLHGVLPTTSETLATGNSGSARNRIFDTGISDLSFKLPGGGSLLDNAILVIDTPGYEGNGEYAILESRMRNFSTSVTTAILTLPPHVNLPPKSNLSWSIIVVSKVKHFRPKLDGTLELVNEITLGLEQPGILFTANHSFYETEVDWYVSRGDLIGVYNAEQLFAGNDPLQVPDALFVSFEGDVGNGIIDLKPPQGEGIEGIGLYGFGDVKEEEAIYDIDLGSPSVVEALEISAEQDVVDLEYNVLAAVGNGVSVSVNTHGEDHHHLPIRASTGFAELQVHPNIAYNVFALTDGIKFARNGVVGAFQSDDPRATYFYVNGDAEWMDLEFPQPPWVRGTGDPFNYRDDPITINYSWDYGKKVHRFVSYFKEFPHYAGYQIEYLDRPGTLYNGSMPGYRLIGGFEEGDVKYTSVSLDDKRYDYEVVTSAEGVREEDQHVHLKHFAKRYDVYYKGPGMTVDEKRRFDASLYHPYRVLDKTWEPVTTKALNFYSFYHYSTKISETELYSKTSSESDLGDIVEVFFSKNGDVFHRAETLKAGDDLLRFTIGSPVRYLRIVINPFYNFTLKGINIIPDSDLVRVKDVQKDIPVKSIDLPPVKGELSASKAISVVNKTGSVADLEISVEVEDPSSFVILKSALDSEDSIMNPEIGPPGHLLLDEGFDLPVTKNVAINAEAYGLRNLAAGKRFYVLDNFKTELDFFAGEIKSDKWEMINTNFPQVSTSGRHVVLSTPGFQMKGNPPGSVNPVGDMTSTLVSRWVTSSSFSASINCQYDSRGSDSSGIGSRIGLMDANGRKIYISRERSNYSTTGGSAGRSSYADYIITDSAIGTVASKRIFCEAGCGSTFGNPNDHLVPYDLKIEYENEPQQGRRSLIFYFRDDLNFDGVFQWEEGSEVGFEVDLNETATPLKAPFKVFIENVWKESPLQPFGTPDPNEGSFVRINDFKFTGRSNYQDLITVDGDYGLVGEGGEINLSNLVTDTVSRPLVTVAIDLGKPYYLDMDLLNLFNDNPSLTDLTLWNSNNIIFSTSNVDNPAQVDWGDADRKPVRWMLLQEVTTEDPIQEKVLPALRVYTDITKSSGSQLKGSDIWQSLGKILTNGDYSNYITQVDYPVIAICLANSFDIVNYKLLSTDRYEYPEESSSESSFKGWHTLPGRENFFVSISYTDTEHPIEVEWNGWQPYPHYQGQSLDKIRTSAKWFSFRNTYFNSLSPHNNEHRASQFVVSTPGLDYSNNGLQTDRVDFTEYASWLDSSVSEYVNVATITSDELGFDGFLYGSSELSNLGLSSGDVPPGASNLFGGDTSTELLLRTDRGNAHFYRVFGTIEGIVDYETLTGNPSEEDAPIGLIEGEPSLVIEPVTITHLEIQLTDNTSSVPKDFQIQILQGNDPERDESWIPVTGASLQNMQSHFGSFVIDPETGERRSFSTQGKFFRYNFETPVSVKGVRIVFTSFEDISGRFKVCNFSDFRIYRESEEDGEKLLAVNDESIRHRGRRSLKLTYPSGNSGTRLVRTPESFILDPDNLWSIQDYLSFYLKVENLAELDLEKSYIRLGRNHQEFYEWGFDLLEISEGNFSNKLLKFRLAREKGGNVIEYDRVLDLRELDPWTDFKKGPISYFEVGICPKNTATKDINVWLDDFTIKREDFLLKGRNHNSLYLTNSELVYFPLTGFNMKQGFFECTITPDWDKDGKLEFTKKERPGDQVFTIFTATNGSDEQMSLYYTDRDEEGLHFTINTPESKLDLIVGEVNLKRRYESHLKISLLWDNEGKRIDARSGTTVRLYLNDALIGDLVQTWEITDTRDTYFLIGSRAYSQAASTGSRQFAEFGFNVPLKPSVQSLNGGIEDLIVATSPLKLNFDKIVPLKDKILISLDGDTYFTGDSVELPLKIKEVPEGGEVIFYMKTNFPKDIRNMARSGFVKTRWLKTV